jgi:hypothetical protein
MTITLIIAVLSLFCTIIIASNNYFGLRDRFKNYLREKLNVPTEKEKINKKRLEKDQELFKEITNYLDSDGNMMIVRDNDFGGSFPGDLTSDLNNFLWECKKPEFEFHDGELEKEKKKLEENLTEFVNGIAVNTFRLNDTSDFKSVPKDWRHRHPEKHRKVVKSLNDKAESTIKVYDKFVRKCRKKLAL